MKRGVSNYMFESFGCVNTISKVFFIAERKMVSSSRFDTRSGWAFTILFARFIHSNLRALRVCACARWQCHSNGITQTMIKTIMLSEWNEKSKVQIIIKTHWFNVLSVNWILCWKYFELISQLSVQTFLASISTFVSWNFWRCGPSGWAVDNLTY